MNLSALFALALQAPQLLQEVHALILSAEVLFPHATGLQKFDAVTQQITTTMPQVVSTIGGDVSAVANLVNGVVAFSAMAGGQLAAIRTGVQAPVLAQSAQTAPVAEPVPQAG